MSLNKIDSPSFKQFFLIALPTVAEARDLDRALNGEPLVRREDRVWSPLEQHELSWIETTSDTNPIHVYKTYHYIGESMVADLRGTRIEADLWRKGYQQGRIIGRNEHADELRQAMFEAVAGDHDDASDPTPVPLADPTPHVPDPIGSLPSPD